LGHVSPIQAMKQWQRSHPELFNRRVTNQPGHDSMRNTHDCALAQAMASSTSSGVMPSFSSFERTESTC